MYGAIAGDIIGSRFEFNNIKTKTFRLFTKECSFTDDTVMTVAVFDALFLHNSEMSDEEFKRILVDRMKYHGRKYPGAGYGSRFRNWLFTDTTEPYNSLGNGSAMRASGCAYAGDSLSEALKFARLTAEVTHNHPEGIKGAEAVTAAMFLAKIGKKKEDIRKYIEENYYSLDFTLDEIRENYSFDVTCMGSVPQAIVAFLEAESYEDAIRNAISIGGDSDTIACITGGIAETYFGVPEDIEKKAKSYLNEEMNNVICQFYSKYVLI
ncbi:MAG: ADP-ribosylglycohydrolase family protein [Clostridia bacterium]|nr:ADP-ribosylglycohydrolase family protein [Clostridia bacterium]